MSKAAKFVNRAAIATALTLAASVPAFAEIQVQVNGNPVRFGATPPVRVDGRVLIPLRAVVEALGADVKWEAATQTVRGRKGEKDFTLQIGSRNATVNGTATPLDVPAQLMSGATMVPLRFVAQALGAEVEWNAAAQQVVVSSHDDGGGAPPADRNERITGEVVSTRPDARPPTLTIRDGNVRQTYKVDQDTVILRGRQGQKGRRADLQDLQPGDTVSLRLAPNGETLTVVDAIIGRDNGARDPRDPRDPNRNPRDPRDPVGRDPRDPRDGGPAGIPGRDPGNAPRLEAVNGRITGEIASVRAEGRVPSITVRNGAARGRFAVTQDTVILRSEGNGKAVRVNLEDLQPGDSVRVRLNADGSAADLIEARGVPRAGQGAEIPVPAAPAPDLRITSFSHDARAMLRSTDQVTVVLRGTPGATATFDAGNLAKDQPLREDPKQPGHYVGTFSVPKGVTVKDVPVIAQLRQGTRTAPLIQAAGTLTVDSEPPTISEVAPADRAEVANQTPDIYAEISDGAGSGLDLKSLRVTIGSRDVTEDVKVTPRFLLYTPKTRLGPGPVPVTITLRDLAGNETQRAWAFTVRQAPAALQSVSHDGNRPLRAGEVLNVTVKGQPRGEGTFSIGDSVKGVRLRETDPGVYTGRYTVKQGDEISRAPVVVEFVTQDGNRVRQESTAPVNIFARELLAPEITSPTRAFQLGDEVVVEGTGTPGSKITVEVTYTGKAFGALPVQGAFGAQEVTVARDGRWTSRPFEARLPLGVRKPSLNITAQAIDAAGTKSQVTRATVPTR